MSIEATPISGLFVVRGREFDDRRGFLRQMHQIRELAEVLGYEPRLLQGNHSRSHAGVLRGFHIEAWSKLIYIVRGTATCVVADPRPESPTFGRTESFVMGDRGAGIRLFVSEGLANAFYCHSETDYLNDVSDYFDPLGRRGIIWNDPDLAVAWPSRSPILSDIDAGLPTLRELFPDHPNFS